MATLVSNNVNDTPSINTVVSETSSHFPNENKKLTPINDLKSLHYHDNDYLNLTIEKANKGETFFPGGVNNNYLSCTPLFNKLAVNNSSTPIQDGIGNNINRNVTTNNTIINPNSNEDINAKIPASFNFNSNPRNIFNPSPAFIQTLPGLKISTNSDGSINPVKGAFNLFDKNSSFASASSSIRSFKKPRKRLRSSTGDTTSESINFSKISSTSHISIQKLHNSNITESINSDVMDCSSGTIRTFYDFWHSVVSNPQCISNITLIIQIFLNTMMFSIFISFGIFGILSIKRDVDRKVSKYINEIIHKMNGCKREYLRNNCAPEMRVPALEYKCNEWDNCMSQDPESVITSVAYFEVLADCMNAFFHNLSIRTIIGISGMFICCVILPNVLFSKFRSTTINKNYYAEKNNPANTANTNNTSHASHTSNTPLRLSLLNNGTEHADPNDLQQIMPASNIRGKTIDTFYTNLNDNSIKSGNNSTNANISGSVRFNPNVSCSLYDYGYSEDENNVKTNQRILE